MHQADASTPHTSHEDDAARSRTANPDAASRGGFKASRHGDGRRKRVGGRPQGEQKRAAEERERAGTAHTSHEGIQVPARRHASIRAASTAARPPPT